MNHWIKKSIDLAHYQGYLDELFKIYPTELGDVRSVSEKTKTDISKAFRNKNQTNLIKELLKLPKFPIDDPYISSLRKHPFLLEKNPKTIKRIGKRLLSMDIGMILELSAKPKSPSRQLGHSFKKWLETVNYPFLNEEKFKKHKGVSFLAGSDRKLKDFAAKELKIRNLKKGMDFILKINNRFILGEAKFLTDHGGTQNNQFNDAIRVAKIKKDRVSGVAVLDGIVWFKSNTHMHKIVKRLKQPALSVLLLEEFIKEQE